MILLPNLGRAFSYVTERSDRSRVTDDSGSLVLQSKINESPINAYFRGENILCFHFFPMKANFSKRNTKNHLATFLYFVLEYPVMPASIKALFFVFFF